MVIKLDKDRINFTKFIQEHDEAIFGKVNNAIGKPNVLAYSKQISALDLKMNEIIKNDPVKAGDPIFLLGLFALAVSQFGVTVKTDVDLYKEDFLQLLEDHKKA